jgi:hypothetical protein
MPAHIDHVIIAGPDLEELEQVFVSLGFTVTGGGEHPHLGTRNRIIILGESYIELLAVANPAIASAALQRRITSGASWVGYALQSDNIEREVAEARARGADVRGPTPGRLVAPDGTVRSWRVATFDTDDLWAAALPLPFLIQHDSIGEQHQRELAGSGSREPHANSATRLMSVTLWSDNPAELRSRLERSYALKSHLSTANASIYSIEYTFEWIMVSFLPHPNSPLDASKDYRNIIMRVLVANSGKREVIMRVMVGVTDLALAREIISQSGLPFQANPVTIDITLPGGEAIVTFIAPLF